MPGILDIYRQPNAGPRLAPQLRDPRGNFWADLPGVTDKWGLYQGQGAADAANPAIVAPTPQANDPMVLDPRLAWLLALMGKRI